MVADALTPRRKYFITLITGMIGCVVLFNIGYELLSAFVIMAACGGLILIDKTSSQPVFDERDLSLAEESSHTALMWTGAVGGIVMILVSIGMGIGWIESYPSQIGPYYLTWGSIMGLAIMIDLAKRFRG